MVSLPQPDLAVMTADVLKLDVEGQLDLTVQDCVGHRFAVLGSPGTGKSNTVARLIEQIRPALDVHILDMHNEYYGLAEKFEFLRVGKSPIIQPGQEDLEDTSPPVHIEAGPEDAARIAEFAYRNRLSVIVQMLYMTEDERLEFTHAYCRRLWELNLMPKRPLVVLMEEAHNFIPQQMGNSPVLKQIGQFASEGRKFGITVIMASQRTAKINKDILADCDFLFLHAVNIYNDFVAYSGMLPYSVAETKKIVMALSPGEAIVKTRTNGPARFLQVKMLLRETYHGGSTPTLDEQQPPPLRAIDSDLVEKMQTLLAQDASDDPAHVPDETSQEIIDDLEGQVIDLKAKLADAEQGKADLQRQLDAAQAEITRLKAQPVAVPLEVVSNGQRDMRAVIEHAASRAPVMVVPAPDVQVKPTSDSQDWNGRSELATARAIKRQEREFEALLTDIRNAKLMHRLALIYLTQREKLEVMERDLARHTGYSLSSLATHRPTEFERRKLIKRILKGGVYHYQSTVRKALREDYPDLDDDKLIDTICKLEKI